MSRHTGPTANERAAWDAYLEVEAALQTHAQRVADAEDAFAPTHRVVVPRVPNRSARREWLVMLFPSGAAPTLPEFVDAAVSDHVRHPWPDWERAAGEWRYRGDAGAFDRLEVEPVAP